MFLLREWIRGYRLKRRVFLSSSDARAVARDAQHLSPENIYAAEDNVFSLLNRRKVPETRLDLLIPLGGLYTIAWSLILITVYAGFYQTSDLLALVPLTIGYIFAIRWPLKRLLARINGEWR